MSQPVLDSVAADLYEALLPLAFADEAYGWPLAHYCAAQGVMLQTIDDLVRDTPAGPGWSPLVDVDRCPAFALPWLAQLVGVTLPAGLTETEQRDLIRSLPQTRRGTLAAIVAAAQQHLTGAKTVVIRERDAAACATEPAYGLTVITFTSETPDPTQTLADLVAQKPVGIVLNYQVEDGQDFELLRESYATFDAARIAYSTFDAMRTDTP